VGDGTCDGSCSQDTLDAALDAGTGSVAFKFQWDEASLRMYVKQATVERLFPRFKFEPPSADVVAETEERKKRGIGSRPSYLVQIMQSSGAAFISGRLDTQLNMPAKLVQTTAAKDLALPIEIMIPTEVLGRIDRSRFGILALHADSVAANKIIVQHVASLSANLPVHDGLCYGCFREYVCTSVCM
jgi:hypothetical protein